MVYCFVDSDAVGVAFLRLKREKIRPAAPCGILRFSNCIVWNYAYAFAADVLEKIELEPLKEALEAQVLARFTT